MAVSTLVFQNLPQSHKPQTIRLLVVEDNEAFLYLIQMAFRSRENIHWELTIAHDGEQAMKLLFEEEKTNAPLPDLILTDWNLPKISGSELLQRIKKHEKLRKIPVLVLSSSEADKDIHDAYDNHANGYITKPSSIDVLAQIVETIEQFWVAVAKLPKVFR
jgi:CheY-like chemotaxis protein